MEEIRNFGFQPPDFDSEENKNAWTLGAVDKKVVLQKDGQWDDYLPDYEPQALDYETWSCTVFGTLNCCEILDRRLFNKSSNYSDTFTASLCQIRKPGANPQTAAENIRHRGVVDERLYPRPKTYDEFTSPVPCDLLSIAKGWDYTLNHEWLWRGGLSRSERMEILKEALTYGPVGISVTAWYERDGIYVDRGKANTHWCTLYGWNNKGWKVFDSYDHAKKIVSFGHNIEFAKSYFLKKGKEEKKWWEKLFGALFENTGVECREDSSLFLRDLSVGSKGLDVLKLQQTLNLDPRTQVSLWGAGSPGYETNYFGERTRRAVAKYQILYGITPPNGYFGPITRSHMNTNTMRKNLDNTTRLLKLAEANLGKDFTNDQVLVDDLSCVFAVSTLLHQIDPKIPVMYGTWVFWDFMRKHPQFIPLDGPELGCIVISPTGTAKRPHIVTNGHCGLYVDGNTIASNSSKTGLWTKNFTTETWKRYYVEKGGYPIFYFKFV